ncbi:hypothetical protein PROFUN_06216 [Planoprotostelium fungivorum]|uniref:EGF-like domain-containing protein n=1 Tax=Planoprotostelium fungivorum TaxID=1890364 RepID=A0A2P6MZ10_9EUKA|nr:hypothetical protein PROFUN_06216 [Planoprotostelium fungivorum]
MKGPCEKGLIFLNWPSVTLQWLNTESQDKTNGRNQCWSRKPVHSFPLAWGPSADNSSWMGPVRIVLEVLLLVHVTLSVDIKLSTKDGMPVSAVFEDVIQYPFTSSCSDTFIDPFLISNTLHFNVSTSLNYSVEIYRCDNQPRPPTNNLMLDDSGKIISINFTCTTTLYDFPLLLIVNVNNSLYPLHVVENWPNGTCINNTCACSDGFYGEDCSIQFSLPTKICPTVPFNLTMGRPNPQFRDLWEIYSDDYCVPTYDSPVTMDFVSCGSYRNFGYVTDMTNLLRYSTVSMEYSYTANLTWFYAPSGTCSFIARRRMEILPPGDPSCIPSNATLSSCPSNCHQHGQCICPGSSPCYCKCREAYFGDTCQYGCGRIVNQGGYTGYVSTNTEGKLYLPGQYCSWNVTGPGSVLEYMKGGGLDKYLQTNSQRLTDEDLLSYSIGILKGMVSLVRLQRELNDSQRSRSQKRVDDDAMLATSRLQISGCPRWGMQMLSERGAVI